MSLPLTVNPSKTWTLVSWTLTVLDLSLCQDGLSKVLLSQYEENR